MKRIAGIIALAIVLLQSCSPTIVPRTEKRNPVLPNIILINVDDMGWKDAGYLGSPFYETPRIDSLAKHGLVFTSAYAAAANCSPSRASLITGQWPTRHGVYTVGSSERGDSKHRKLIPVGNSEQLPPDKTTIPQVLKDMGYTTIHAGKWHISEDPREFGFDINIAGGIHGEPKSYYLNKEQTALCRSETKYLTNYIMQQVLDSLRADGRPFFLNYWPYAVHKPIHPVPDLHTKFTEKLGATGGKGFPGQNNAGYASMIGNLDRCIGQLIDWLEGNGMIENTLIIFTSDNGGEFGLSRQSPLRAGKGSYYEGGIRIPMFLYWKGNIHGGRQLDIPVSQIDIFPTLLDILRADSKALQLDGQSLVTLLNSRTTTKERPLFWHYPVYIKADNILMGEYRDAIFRTRPGSAVRLGDWKLLYYFENGDTELFDLAEDISERKNLSEERPDIVQKLLDILTKWWADTGAPIPADLNPDFL